MKYLKKFASIALALVMVLALCAPAFADEVKTGSITVTNPQKGETYTIYKLLDLSYGGTGVENEATAPEVSGSNDPHTYTVAAGWEGFFGKNTIKGIYVSIDEQGYVTWVEDASAADFAKAAMEYANEHKIANQGTITPTEAAPNVKFESLSLGYYLIDSSLGALCALDSTNYNANVTEKNSLPTLDKKIVETTPAVGETPAGTQLVASTTASYGDTVTFDLKVEIPESAVGEMIVHDVMDANLTYVSLVEGALATEVAKEDMADETCTNEFLISAETVADNLGETIHIQYTATLNANAPTGTSIKNTAHLSYSKYETPKSEVEVFTFEFDVVKTDGSGTLLPGATFKLYDAATEGSEIALVEEDDGTYRVATPGEVDAEGFESATITAGTATIKGLSNGTYYLEEITPPKGYNKLTERKEVEISGTNNNATTNATNYQNGGVQVINNSGVELPSTGGIGTTIFYVVGGVLVLGAVVLLITKRRTSVDDE